MAIRIFNNIASVNAQRILGVNNDRLSQSIERISSGMRINKGADDAAGLAISEGLRSDIRALRQATRNANDGISLINTTEGALNEQSSILIRLRELASQAATGTVGSTERATIQLEFSALRDELTRIAQTTEFNGIGLIDGTLASSVASTSHTLIQIGIEEGANLVAGGTNRPEGLDKGYFVRPTVFSDVKTDMKIAKEEIFGPVVSIMPFENEKEAISISNNTSYGLTNYIQTEDKEKAKRV